MDDSNVSTTSLKNIAQLSNNVDELSLTELFTLIEQLLSSDTQLQDQIDPSSISICSKEYPRAQIISLLQRYASHHPSDWYSYQSWETSEPYSRNLIAHVPNRFTLMLVCWKGASDIHNHAGSDCLMAVLRGSLLETKYQLPVEEQKPDRLAMKEVMILSEGQVHLINEQIGLHKMEVVEDKQTAVTLHCYIPPYSDCLCFFPSDNQVRSEISHTTYDTEYGEKVENK